MTTGDCREWLLEKDPEMLFWLFWAGSPRLGTSSGAVASYEAVLGSFPSCGAFPPYAPKKEAEAAARAMQSPP